MTRRERLLYSALKQCREMLQLTVGKPPFELMQAGDKLRQFISRALIAYDEKWSPLEELNLALMDQENALLDAEIEQLENPWDAQLIARLTEPIDRQDEAWYETTMRQRRKEIVPLIMNRISMYEDAIAALKAALNK